MWDVHNSCVGHGTLELQLLYGEESEVNSNYCCPGNENIYTYVSNNDNKSMIESNWSLLISKKRGKKKNRVISYLMVLQIPAKQFVLFWTCPKPSYRFSLPFVKLASQSLNFTFVMIKTGMLVLAIHWLGFEAALLELF